jgi:hypothetical protein
MIAQNRINAFWNALTEAYEHWLDVKRRPTHPVYYHFSVWESQPLVPSEKLRC